MIYVSDKRLLRRLITYKITYIYINQTKNTVANLQYLKKLCICICVCLWVYVSFPLQRKNDGNNIQHVL